MESPDPQEEKQEPSLLHKIRNMWEFASVMQYIFMFGKSIKIDEDFDIEVCMSFINPCSAIPRKLPAEHKRCAEWLIWCFQDFENECLRPGYSEKLEEIGLTLLKWISSHRGLKCVDFTTPTAQFTNERIAMIFGMNIPAGSIFLKPLTSTRTAMRKSRNASAISISSQRSESSTS